MNILIFLLMIFLPIYPRGVGCRPCGSCTPEVIYKMSGTCMPRTSDVLAGNSPAQIQYRTSFPISSSEFIRLAKYRDAAGFRAMLANIVAQFRHQPQAFIDIMNVRDDDGYTVPMFFAVIADIENLAITLDAVGQVLGHDPVLIYEIFKQKDPKKINLLGQAVYSADFRVIELVLSRAIEFLGKNKELFFLFMNAGENKEGWKPLIDAADDSLSKALEMMIKAADLVLGKGTELFDKFINAQDEEGFSALDSAQNFTDRLLLKRSGEHTSIKTAQEEAKLTRPLELGRKLIAASNRADFQSFQEILSQGIKEFKGDPDLLFNFFYARDEAGWNALIHTAADGQYEYVKLIIQAMEENFDEADKYSKSIIIANVDFEGRTALHLAIARHNFKIAQLLMHSLMNYVVTKPFLFSLINSPVGMTGFTPLMFLVYISNEFDLDSFAFLKIMLRELSHFFGVESRMFWRLVNSRDYNNWTVLAYASDHKTQNLLKSYGAVDTQMPKIVGLGKYFERYYLDPHLTFLNTSLTDQQAAGYRLW